MVTTRSVSRTRGSQTLCIFRLREPNWSRETLTSHVAGRGHQTCSPHRSMSTARLLSRWETSLPGARGRKVGLGPIATKLRDVFYSTYRNSAWQTERQGLNNILFECCAVPFSTFSMSPVRSSSSRRAVRLRHLHSFHFPGWLTFR
jgi:hypothetical protein